jgi:hypothetical protein
MSAFPEQALVDRRDLEEIIGEQDLLKGRLDDGTRAKIRKILGVKAIIYPNYESGQFSIKIVDTETGEIVAATLVSGVISDSVKKSTLIRQAVKELEKKSKNEESGLLGVFDLRVAAKLDFQTVTPVEVRQRNDNQLLNSYFHKCSC